MAVLEATTPSMRGGTNLRALMRKVAGVLLGMSLVNAGNYAVNIIFGRYLDANALGDVVLITTCLLILGSLSVAIQFATARGVADAASPTGTNERAVMRDARRLSIALGLAISLILVMTANYLSDLFKVGSSAPFWWLAAISPLLLIQGAQRGLLQGRDRTLRLTATFQSEMVVRLVVSWVALELGFGVDGVCAALFASVLASLATIGPNPKRAEASAPVSIPSRHSFASMMRPALVAQLSVMVFTQVDVILVKARANPAEAGAFAIVVLIGRIVTFTTQAVSTPLLPAIVERVRRGRRASDLLGAAMGAILVVGVPLVVFTLLIPERVITILFGSQHIAAAPFLGLYALGMLAHSGATLIIDYAFCHGANRISYISAALGLCKLVAGLLFIHDVHSAVLVNLISSAILFGFVFLGALALRRATK